MIEIRKNIYALVYGGRNISTYGKAYDIFMILVIFASLLPLMVKLGIPSFNYLNQMVAVIFAIDYLLRFSVADLLLKRKGLQGFLRYPFTPMALVDLVSVLPYILISFNSSLSLFKLFRLLRMLSAFSLFKLLRYSQNVTTLVRVFQRQRQALIVVFGIAIGYALVCALIIFNVEPETFSTFFDAVYWAIVSLVTIGYGDIYAVSSIGRLITILSSMIGVAIIALPAGVITAGYVEELQRQEEEKRAEKNRATDI